MTFALDVDYNKYLLQGAVELHAAITVTSQGGQPVAAASDKAVVLVVDTSLSMQNPSTKIRAARRAAATAIDLMPEGTMFALVGGDHEARCLYPTPSEGLARASQSTRAEAIEAARRLHPSGGTAMSTWIDLVRSLLEPYPGAIRLAYLLTDGKNESEPCEELDAALARAEGVFQCDARGVGVDWLRDELFKISSALLGTADMIEDPEEMGDDFRSFMARAIGQDIADVNLRLRTPRDTRVRVLRQVHPTVEYLSDKARALDDLTKEYPTGAWSGQESRSYHLCLDLRPAEIGKPPVRVAQVTLMQGEDDLAKDDVVVNGTDDVVRATTPNRQVAALTGRVEQAESMEKGAEALERGDVASATVHFGRAAKDAHVADDQAGLRLLEEVVDIEDAANGTVRVKPNVEKQKIMKVGMRSRRTKPVHRSPTPAGQGPAS